jgi:hypothetical protein
MIVSLLQVSYIESMLRSATTLIEELLRAPEPPWRPMPSRRLAAILGVSLQSLANWRVRGNGPEPEPKVRGKGNRTFYRPDVVMAWLASTGQEPWEFSRDWLARRGLSVEEPTRESTEFLIGIADPLV